MTNFKTNIYDTLDKVLGRLLSSAGLVTVAQHEARVANEKSRLESEYSARIDQLQQELQQLQKKNKPPIPPVCIPPNAFAFKKPAKVPGIVGDQDLPVTPEKILAFKHKVNAINAIEAQKPSSEQNKILFDSAQEEVLFCKSPAANVSAGAGSGKSTVLVLRVLFLNQILEQALETITVCTFTNASRRDFIDKLMLRFVQWGKPISYRCAENVVRTFHSLAYHIHRYCWPNDAELLNTHKNQRVEQKKVAQLGDKELWEQDDSADDESKLKLKEYLAVAYKSLFNDNDLFRVLVRELHCAAIRKSSAVSTKYTKNPNYYHIQLIKNNESEYANYCLSFWFENRNLERLLNQYKISIVDNLIKAGELEFTYHIYLPHLDLYLFLGIFYKRLTSHCKLFSSKASVKQIQYHRKLYVYECAPLNYVLVEHYAELERLFEHEQALCCLAEGRLLHVAPSFEYVCEGRKTSYDGTQSSQFFDNCYELISFAHSMGISLAATNSQKLFEALKKANSSPDDIKFVRATILLQGRLYELLADDGFVTYDEVIHHFRQENPISLEGTNKRYLERIKHLMIDEFQDISPNLIAFVCGLKKAYIAEEKKDEVASSIMVVGDERQSIYGWRGSSPIYSTHFKELFQIPAVANLALMNNYRSAQLIIDIGGDVIAHVPQKGRLPCKAVGSNANAAISEFRQVENQRSDDAIDYAALHQQLLNELAEFLPTKENPIFILYRQHRLFDITKIPYEPLVKTLNDCEKKGTIRLLTIHSSKGLEADSVFIAGDIQLADGYPIREALYQLAGMPMTYEKAQNDEAFRLAYVAVTRAKTRCFWFYSTRGKNQCAKYLQNRSNAVLASR